MTDLEKKILTKLYGDSPSDFRRHAEMGFSIYNSAEKSFWKAGNCPFAIQRMLLPLSRNWIE